MASQPFTRAGDARSPREAIAELHVEGEQATALLRQLLDGKEAFLPCADPPGAGAAVWLVVSSPHLHAPVRARVTVTARRCAAGGRGKLAPGATLRIEHVGQIEGLEPLLRAYGVLWATSSTCDRALDVKTRRYPRLELFRALWLLAGGDSVELEVQDALREPATARVSALSDDGLGCTFEARVEPVDGGALCRAKLESDDERRRVARYVSARNSGPLPRAARAS